VLFGEAHFATGEESQRQRTVEETVRASLQSLPNTFVTAIDAVHGESGWAVRADVAAPRVLAPGDVRNVEERTAKAIGEPVDLTVRARTDVLVTGRQYQAVGDVPLPEERNGMPTPEARSP
jgi:anti-sigma factor RsiW